MAVSSFRRSLKDRYRWSEQRYTSARSCSLCRAKVHATRWYQTGEIDGAFSITGDHLHVGVECRNGRRHIVLEHVILRKGHRIAFSLGGIRQNGIEPVSGVGRRPRGVAGEWRVVE